MENEFNMNQEPEMGYDPRFDSLSQAGTDSPAPEAPVQPEPPKKKKKSGMGGAKVTALCLCCAIVGGICGGAGAYLIGRHGPGSAPTSTDMLVSQRETSIIETHTVDTSRLKTASEVYAENVRSTVGITTSITTNYWGFQTMAAAAGSGFIISDDGYILTNYHVVEDANSITVAMYDGETYPGKLVGFDPRNDVAVLKIEANDLVPVVLGDSDKLNVGDSVVAIGNPLGELTFSLTSGAISSMNREITMSGGTTMNLMQTDCAINSGNSGGALFNMYGEVIGITNAKYSSNSGSGASIDNIGFAIPINMARSIAQSIIEKGYVSAPYIGVSVMDVGQQFLEYGIPAGASIQAVSPDSPAEKAGLMPSDIITHINDTEISGSADLSRFIREAGIGSKLKLTVYRKGETLHITVTVGERIPTQQ